MPIQAVAIVVYDGVQALDVAGPMDVFSEANTFLSRADRYDTILVAAHHSPLRASNGIRLVADLTFEEAAGGFDIILVAGAPTPPETEPEPHLVQWVKELPWRSSVYGSICAGAEFLGVFELTAGLLIACRIVDPRLSSIGGAMGAWSVCLTLSCLFTTPGVIPWPQWK